MISSCSPPQLATRADPHVGNLVLSQSGALDVNPGEARRTLDHGPTGEGAAAEASDLVVVTVVCNTRKKEREVLTWQVKY